MSTNFPASLDDSSSLPNPGSGNLTNAPSHAGLHTNANDAIKALEAKIGIGSATPTSTNILRGNGTGTSTWGKLVLSTDVTGVLAVVNGGTGITTFGSGIATFLGTPSSANLAATIADATGTGVVVLTSSPTIVTPTIASFTNAQHNHSNAAGGGQLTGSTAITDGTITPAGLMAGTGASWAWQSWTPTYSAGITVGNGTHASKYVQIGKTVTCRLAFTFGTTSSMGAGGAIFTLPVTAAAGVPQYMELGNGLAVGGAARAQTFIRSESTTTASMYMFNVSGAIVGEVGFTSTTPGVWTTGNYIYATFVYEAA